MNVDDLIRPAAERLVERTRAQIDLDAALRSVMTPLADTPPAGHGDPRARSRSRRAVPALVGFVAVLIVVAMAVVAVVALTTSDHGQPAAPDHSFRGAYGALPTRVPSGFRPTQRIEISNTGGTGACCDSRTVVFGTTAGGGTVEHPILVRIIRNPLNGPLADQDPASVAETTDNPVRLRWTRAPDWEFQLESDDSRKVIGAFTAGIVIPDPATSTIGDVTFSTRPAGSRKILDSTSPISSQQSKSVTYARAYGATPYLEIRTSSMGLEVLDVQHLRILQINGHEAFQTVESDQNRNVIHTIQWRSPIGAVSVSGTGLSESAVAKAARSVRGVTQAEWKRATRNARQPAGDPSRSPAILQFLSGFLRSGPDAIVQPLGTAASPQGTYTFALGHFNDAGTRWLSAVIGTSTETAASGSGQCTDPNTGFASPFFLGAVNQPKAVVVSYKKPVASVDIELLDGTHIAATAVPTESPTLYYAILDRDQTGATVIARNAAGHVLHRTTAGR